MVVSGGEPVGGCDEVGGRVLVGGGVGREVGGVDVGGGVDVVGWGEVGGGVVLVDVDGGGTTLVVGGGGGSLVVLDAVGAGISRDTIDEDSDIEGGGIGGGGSNADLSPLLASGELDGGVVIVPSGTACWLLWVLRATVAITANAVEISTPAPANTAMRRRFSSRSS